MKIELNKIICGDALSELKKLPDESIDCCITSPPYFNLRNYQTKRQIGLEKTYQEYIAKLIAVFDEVKRVLKKEGTCFVNLGDTFNGNKIGNTNLKWVNINTNSFKKKKQEMSKKSLMMIPERFAIEMINQKWILRNKLVWIKRNAMPENIKDRWKKAHEYIFFFTKSKKYYFNLDAIRTPHKPASIKRAEYEQGRNAFGLNPSSMGVKYQGNKRYMGMPARIVKLNPKGAVPPDYFLVNTNCSEHDGAKEHWATYPQDLIIPLLKAGCPENGVILDMFVGSGTTGVVAKKMGRSYILIDISEKYCEIARQRIKATPTPLL